MRKLITAALPYTNGALHLGHLAGVYLPGDIYARYLRSKSEDVEFVCGSDEHGAAIQMRALKEGLSEQEIVDKYHELNYNTFKELNISFDKYIRTSSLDHKELAKSFFKKLLDNNKFDVIETEEYYDASSNVFLADRFISGECPHCHNIANGDQCESCGSSLSPSDLINPVSTLSGSSPILRKTKHWYFRLSDYEEQLRDWINTLDMKYHVKQQCLSWLNGGLSNRAITRDLKWGVDISDIVNEEKVLYVWFDAPIGYITASSDWNNSEITHFIGKDNIVFHCIIFPAMLLAHGDYKLPDNIPANQFLNLQGNKFSKSRNWVIEQHQYLIDFDEFENKVDALRYVLTKLIPENQDTDFKWDEFVNIYDGELVDTIGNFFHRVTSFVYNKYNGEISSNTSFDTSVIVRVDNHIRAFRFKEALNEIVNIAREGNSLFQETQPWKDIEGSRDIVKRCLDMCVLISTLLEPFIPESAIKLQKVISSKEVCSTYKISKPSIVFNKISSNSELKKIISNQKDKLS